MPQYPTPLTVLAPGGSSSALNITAPTVIKADRGRRRASEILQVRQLSH